MIGSARRGLEPSDGGVLGLEGHQRRNVDVTDSSRHLCLLVRELATGERHGCARVIVNAMKNLVRDVQSHARWSEHGQAQRRTERVDADRVFNDTGRAGCVRWLQLDVAAVQSKGARRRRHGRCAVGAACHQREGEGGVDVGVRLDGDDGVDGTLPREPRRIQQTAAIAHVGEEAAIGLGCDGDAPVVVGRGAAIEH